MEENFKITDDGIGITSGTINNVVIAGENVGKSNLVEILQDAVFVEESTTEPIRNLASIRKIASIEPIEGADRIVCATVDGWKLVTQKSNNFQPGDLVVYFEIDSFLPVEDRFEFLRPSSFKSTKHLGDGFRIKTIKLKGQVSQGLILPISEFFEYNSDDCNWYRKDNSSVDWAVEGEDLTEWLGVKKWEKPLSPQLQGVARGNFPSFIRKTDQERVQNIFGRLKHKHDQDSLWETSIKLDGSSMTVYVNGVGRTEEELRFGVCSRNLDLKESEGNIFWKVARELNLEEHLIRVAKATGKNFAIQGELMGPGVQDNREKFVDHKFFLFDIWDIDEQRYMSPTERLIFTLEHDLCHIEIAPILGMLPLSHFESVQSVLDYVDSVKSINHDIPEGVVFKSWNGEHSFKCISNKFLLKEKD